MILKGVMERLMGRREEGGSREIYIKAIPLRAYEDVDVIKGRLGTSSSPTSHPSPRRA